MGLSARRPQLPSLNLPSARSSERKDILIEQFDFDDERLEDTTEIVLDSHRAFRPDPSTPVTPLPGTPLVFDEAPSHRSGTPVTPGFANGPNPFSFSFSQRSPSSSSHTPSSSPLLQPSKGISSALAEGHLAKGVAMAENSPGIGLHPSGLGLIPSFGTLNGLSTLKKGRGSNPSGGTRQNDKDASHEEVPWNDRELETLESFLLNPLRPLSTTYPPGTLPPPAALDELTSQIIHFHRPTPTSLAIDDLHPGSPKQGGITSSRSAPSLKVDASASHYVGKGRHRRTHSSSGVVWKHSWPSTRQKLYEVARKEALGDSREDRFKGRLDIKKRALFTGSDMDPGPISPMPENMSDGLSFDFASQRDVPGTMIRSGIPGHIGTSQTGCYDGQDFTTKTTSKWSADSNITTSSVGPTIRPISLLQRGKSFTAEDFDAAMTLDESVKEKSWTSLKHPSTDSVQPPQYPTSTVNTTPPPIFALPRGRVSGSSPLSSEGPKTPEAPPGITLTSPSPCGRHRNEQMRGMGSPIPGSDDRPGAFGDLLDFAAGTADKPDAPRRKNRPSPLMRSRSTWDESQTPSTVAQFIQGPPLFQTIEHDLNRSQPFRVSEHRTDTSSQGQTPFAKRQKVQGTETNLEE